MARRIASVQALAGPGINLSVEMETGTGKTYTYVKTIYELNARYGWSRFIIVVPSVAVREGVYRSLQTTQEHFAGEYGRRLRFFIYNSDRLAQVDRFASDSAIQVMIINMQAFNSGRNQRIIDQRPDSFRGRRPIDVIAATRPILIIDEPQSVEGRQTRESLRKFNALFTLRYSATHREAYNMVYRLDALDAYNRHLVKRIAALGVTFTSSPAAGGFVYLEGVDLSRDRAPAARIGFEVKGASGIRTVVKQLRRKADLFAASNGLAEYADRYVVAEIDGRDSSVTFLNGLKLYAGQFSGGEERTALQRRVQIGRPSAPTSAGNGSCIPGE
ncbi:DEAD/DEAH box helicase family protein [Oscillibacter sp.]|uniref:DEAD/DEAH box helicase family protein n=1 Tax=Oscillibacter sp. TaxID=1945593 RepID=UPI002579800B|nr:DEAD/DEAH box helicase family protein [Oscillibacter sp.]